MSTAQHFAFHVKSLSGELIHCSFSLSEGIILSVEHIYYYVWQHLPSKYKEGRELWNLKLFNDSDEDDLLGAIQRSETINFLIQPHVLVNVGHQNTSFGPTSKMRDLQGNQYSTHQLYVTYSDDIYHNHNRWDILFIGRRDQNGTFHLFHRNDIKRPGFSSMSYHTNVFDVDEEECNHVSGLYQRAVHHDPGLWYDFPPTILFHTLQEWDTLLTYNI
jgi:hypothetical protein